MPAPVLELDDVEVRRGSAYPLSGVSWRVDAGERWVVLGPNGSGKTTLLAVASTYLFPSRGRVEVLGHRLGRVDVRTVLRPRIGYASAPLERLLPPSTTVLEAVTTARRGALVSHRQPVDGALVERARERLAEMDALHLAGRALATCSEGERRRVAVARSLLPDPALLLLDEPTAGLDLGGRERLVDLLGRLAARPSPAAIVLVTHHVEEIPPGFTHLALFRGGHVVAQGPIDEILTAEALSDLHGLPLRLDRIGERWMVTAP